MSKYKKIFSGLGLLSISTLIGAGVVACAKNPSPKDSSTEAIDQNNNQGNSTTPEQGKPKTPQNPAPGTDHNNQEKPEVPKEGTPTPEAPKTETSKNPEMSKENPKQNDNTGTKTMVQTIMHKKKINQLLHRNQNLNQKLQLKQNQWN
ncbi:hypothetical protein NW062_05340 [Mycoplasmopsis cynos]|nr:hypothetical protein NW062_05340 [Mycoplasmopsis cynos]